MANLILMCGLPGSGKSTYLSKYKNDPNCAIISRDEIRFSLLKEGEDYFSHENEVCEILWNKINKSLAENKTTFVDQTSLTLKSRRHLLKHITSHYELCNIIWFNVPIDICLERNENRKGTKAYVPRGVIRRMSQQMVPPSYNEMFDNIIIQDENNISMLLED